MNTNLSKFGKNLKKLRLAANFSLREICKKVGYDPSNWSKIERGRMAPPSGTLKKWASALGLHKGTKQFEEFVDEGDFAQGIIPSEMMNDKVMMTYLPAFFRTIKNKKSKKEEIDRLVELIKNL